MALTSLPIPSIQAQAIDSSSTSLEIADEVESFMDGFFGEHMEDLRIPGAVVTVVKDSTILFKKGYGFADLERNVLVDPDTTLFQVASISKLFTATAVMQVAEQGAVDLHTDVNQYLQQFKLEDAFDAPVTLAHLLTHTGGFDERNIGYIARDAASKPTLSDYLSERMPPRTMPPGEATSYSNHGMALAGHIVEAVSGKPFEQYVADQIFAPLGMDHSSFETPLPAVLATSLAQGYRWNGEEYAPVPLFVRKASPAGGLSATATDMARFMIAHLNDGKVEGKHLLLPETIATMHQQQFTHHPRLPGYAYGFGEQVVNGYRMLQHGGDNPGYGSLLFLIPEENIGMFLSTNVLSNRLRQLFVPAFMDQFFPPLSQTVTLQPEVGASERVARFTGSYVMNRYARRSLEKLLLWFGNQYLVWSDSVGYLVTQDGVRWVEVEPLLFRHAEEPAYIAFRENEQSEVTHLFRGMNLGGVVPAAYEKAAWHESGRFLNEFYLSWIPTILLTWIIWPIGWLFRIIWSRWKKQPMPVRTRAMRVARWLATFFGVSVMVFAFGFIQKAVRQVERGGGELLYGMPDALQTMLWLPIVQVVLALGLVIFAGVAWRKSYWRMPGRLHFSVFTLAALIWIYFLADYNLIGFNY